MKHKREFTIIIEKDADGWFVASVPSIKGCHTQGKTIDQAIERVKEAILLCLETGKIPFKTQFELVGVQRVKI